MNRAIRTAVVATVALVAFAAMPASSASALNATGARSVVVNVFNGTRCTIVQTSHTIWHGVWITNGMPPGQIAQGVGVSFGSESSGFMTGTEAKVSFTLQNCVNASLNNHPISIFWDNPFVGANTLTFSPSTPDVEIFIEGGGFAGDNATASFIIATE